MYNLLCDIPLNIDWRQMLLHLLNLVILFLVLYFLLYNPVKKFIEQRKKHYEQLDEQTKQNLAEAEDKKAAYDELLNNADEEISTKKRLAINDARTESERIIKTAEEESSAILKKATEEAQKIKIMAKSEAMAELSDSISDAAMQKIDAACSVDGFISENSKHD